MVDKTYDDVVLVTLNGKHISIGVGKYCFPIENDELTCVESQETGAAVSGKQEEFDDAYSLAAWAFMHRMYDSVEKH